MSLYRQHQRHARMVEWADYARLMLPVVAVMDVAGVLEIGSKPGAHILAMVGAAAVTWIGVRWHRHARAALARFENAVNRNPRLSTRYKADAEAGLIADLRGELAVSLAVAAFEARRGNTAAAGLLYGNAKVVESRLRKRGC